MIKCIGCGSTLQTIDENKEGYISEETLTKHREMAYCKDAIKFNTMEK